MTIKEYNNLRTSVYQAAVESSAEIAEALRVSGIAYVYEAEQEDKHIVLVLTHRSQLNDNTLKQRGINAPEKASARLVLTLNRQTKCATF